MNSFRRTGVGTAQKIAMRRIALVIAASAALLPAAYHQAQTHEHRGMHGQGHDKLHHWYKTLRQPGTGYACCDNTDCRPSTARVRDGGLEVLVDGEWTIVPANTIIDRLAPDLNTHVCAPKGPWSPKPIYCVVLGIGV